MTRPGAEDLSITKFFERATEAGTIDQKQLSQQSF